MKKFLKELDKDIKRCETVLKENNYIEIVIAVEELIDKYKPHIKELLLDIDRDRVWNYSKKDLESLKEKLIKYRNDNLGELMFNNARQYLTTQKELSIEMIEETKKILEQIEIIYNENTQKEEKWNRLKIYLPWISNQDINIAAQIISIINTIIQIEY